MISEHSPLFMPHATFKAFFLHFLEKYVHVCPHRGAAREEELTNKQVGYLVVKTYEETRYLQCLS